MKSPCFFTASVGAFYFLSQFNFFLTESEAMGSLNGGRGTLDNFGTWKTNIVFAALPISILFCIVAISSQRGAVSRGFVFSFPSSCKSCFANAELIHKSAAWVNSNC